MSNSDELRVSLIEESTPGVTPLTPAMLVLQTTGQDLTDLVRYIESQTLTSRRNVKDLSRVSRSSAGNLPAELFWASSTEALFHAVRAVMCSAEDAEITVASCTAVAGGNTLTRPSGNWTTGNAVKVDDIVKLSGGTAEDMGYFRVSAVDPTTLTFDSSIVFTGSIGNVSVKRGARMDNGTTHRHFSVEISKLDINQHNLFKKQVFNTMDVAIAVGAISTMSFGMVGGLSVQSGTEVGASYTDPAVRTVMDAISVPLLLVGGVEYEMSNLRMNVSNNAQSREKVGSDSVGTIRRGKFRVSGNAQWYHDGFVEYEKFVGNESTSIALVNEDADGAAWSWHLPRAKWSNLRAPTTGPNADDYMQGDFTAIEAEAGGYTLRTQRFTA